MLRLVGVRVQRSDRIGLSKRLSARSSPVPPRRSRDCPTGEMPNEIRGKIELWIGCIVRALEDHEYETSWTRWGQKNRVEPTRVYNAAQAKELLCSIGPEANRIAAAVDGKFASAFIRAQEYVPL